MITVITAIMPSTVMITIPLPVMTIDNTIKNINNHTSPRKRRRKKRQNRDKELMYKKNKSV